MSSLTNSGYPNTNSSFQDWENYLDRTILPHIEALLNGHPKSDHQYHIYAAVQYVTTTLLTFMGNYTEDFQMGGQAKIETTLSQLQELRNRIQNDFNTMQAATGSAATTAAEDAYAAYFGGTLSDGTNTPGIKKILTDNQSMFDPTFISSVEQEFEANSEGQQGPIFGTTGGDPNNPSTDSKGKNLVAYWQKMWGSNNPDDPNSTQPVTNALTSVASDFSSQNSTAESRIKFYEANDEQYKSMTHSMMTEIINEEKQSTTATQSAGS
jgi:ribosomal protein L17